MEWISVEDKLPEPRVEVLVFIDDEWTHNRAIKNLNFYSSMYISYMCHGLEFNKEEGKFYETGPITWNTMNKVTHWMKLPKEPNERGSDKSRQVPTQRVSDPFD